MCKFHKQVHSYQLFLPESSARTSPLPAALCYRRPFGSDFVRLAPGFPWVFCCFPLSSPWASGLVVSLPRMAAVPYVTRGKWSLLPGASAIVVAAVACLHVPGPLMQPQLGSRERQPCSPAPPWLTELTDKGPVSARWLSSGHTPTRVPSAGLQALHGPLQVLFGGRFSQTHPVTPQLPHLPSRLMTVSGAGRRGRGWRGAGRIRVSRCPESLPPYSQ